MDSSVEEARAKLAQRFGKVQLGGKGTVHAHSIWDRQRLQLPALLWISILCKARDLTVFLFLILGTQRRPQKKTPHN